ncbi:MAG: phosphoserine phosphatase [Thermoplasmatales archaeon]|nr:phosphoserine phosphatase [Thermoplasmatales archaeon]
MKGLDREAESADKAADRHRAKRDELNAKTREWVSIRDGLNAQVREYVDEASKHRETRDEFNAKVQESKELRDECNKAVSKLSEQIQELRKDLPPQEKGRPSISQLRREFNHLEIRQQTSVLKKKEEESVIKRMREISDLIDEYEKSDLQDGDYKDKVTELRNMKAKAEEHHRDVSKYADLAQTEHDAMIELYGKADAVRKEADEAQAKFIECKKAADEEHKLHIAALQSMHKAEDAAAAIKSRQRDARRRQEIIESKKEASLIFERFKNGEKLSTDDLLTLQKSGYL